MQGLRVPNACIGRSRQTNSVFVVASSRL